MRILIWHGYLLGGTGSNVYTRSLARTWSRQGHNVVVVSQDPNPAEYDLGGAHVVRPALQSRLPVFVLDRYADAEPVLLADMPADERARFVDVNAEAVRALLPADLLLVNHVLLGAPVGAASGVPFVVKAHGSELEFAIRGNRDLADWAAATLSGAKAVLAGSQHIVNVLDEVVGPGVHTARTHVLPPGVDVDSLVPLDRAAAIEGILAEARADPPNPDRRNERLPDPHNAARLNEFLSAPGPVVLYVGKLSSEKGVSLLLEALRPLDARALIVGFGPARSELEAAADGRVLFTGPLEHRHLRFLWPLAAVAVTPSVFPEAFGMVAAEAASCGCPPLVADHSGLAEIAARLRPAYPPDLRHLAAFTGGDVDDLRAKLAALLALPPERSAQLSRAARETAVRTWSWDGVGERILALA